MRSLFRKGFLKSILLFLLVGAFIKTRSQVSEKKVDSLAQLIAHSRNDTDLVRLEFQLGRMRYQGSDIYGGIDQLRRSVALAYKRNFFPYAADAMTILANAYITLERYDSVFILLKNAMDIAVKYKEDDNIANINHNYLYLYNMLGDTKTSLEYGFKAIDGFEKSKDVAFNMMTVYAWIEIGRVFETEKQFDKALYYYNKSLAKGKTSPNDFYILPALINIANIYLKQEHPNEAANFYKQALNKTSKPGSGINYKMWALLGLSDVDVFTKNFTDAIKYAKEALKVAEDYNIKVNIDNCLGSIGHAYMLSGQYDSAEIYLDKALSKAIQSGGWRTVSDSYQYLSELYENQRNFKKALYYNRLHEKTSDTIYNKEKMAALNNMEILYQTNKKEQEIIRLQSTNNAKEIELLKRKRLLAITLSVIGLAGLFFIIYWRIGQKNKMIAKQERVIREQKITSLEQEQKVVTLKSMLDGQEKERTRIAKDLHDGLSGVFSTIKMHMSTLQHENEFLRHDDLFLKSYHMIDTASDDLRRIAHNMMPEVLQKMGLIDALKDFCNSISAKNSLKVNMLSYGINERLPIQTEIMLYRIVQELLNNVVKHSGATEAIVQFNKNENHIDITVEDNGSGCDLPTNKSGAHTGLDTIRERVNFLNGEMSIETSTGIGTTVMISVNIEKDKV
ncbi:MAG: sensor histidine kinase [Ginsengibacter sp.]